MNNIWSKAKYHEMEIHEPGFRRKRQIISSYDEAGARNHHNFATLLLCNLSPLNYWYCPCISKAIDVKYETFVLIGRTASEAL